MSIDELIAGFSLERVGSTAAVFDNEKLLWMNGHYIREMDVGELADRIEEFLTETRLAGLPGANGKPKVASLVPLVQEKMKTLADFVELTDIFYLPLVFEEKALARLRKDANAPSVLEGAARILAGLQPL